MKENYLLSSYGEKSGDTPHLPKQNWFRPKVDSNLLRPLMEKSDARALQDTILWLGTMFIFAALSISLWP